MRRMNYNPFETPFASGECLQRTFILDKPLELNSVYLILVCGTDGEVSTAILSTCNVNKNNIQFFSTGYVDYDADGNKNIFLLEWLINTPLQVEVTHDLITPFNGKRTIYIYKIS